MPLPLGDWQFYVVTILGLAGVLLLVRPFLPSRRTRSGCRGCGLTPPGSDRGRAKLTVRGRRV